MKQKKNLIFVSLFLIFAKFVLIKIKSFKFFAEFIYVLSIKLKHYAQQYLKKIISK